MKRQRFVNLLLAVACVIMTGVTLRQYSVPIVPAADAQGGADPGGARFTPAADGFRPATLSVRKATAAAIRTQLQAFARDDYQTAIKYQSHALRGHFPSAQQFRQMITQGYPEFAHFKSVKFKDALSTPNGNRALVEVVLQGQDGKTVTAFYQMIREDGSYKIDGVSGGSHPPMLTVPGTAVDA